MAKYVGPVCRFCRREGEKLFLKGERCYTGKCINVPSYHVTIGDVVEIREKSKKNISIQSSMASAQARLVPEWLNLDKASVKGTVNALPTRDMLSQTIKEQLIVELYSR